MVWKPNFRHLEKLSKKEFDKKKSNDSYFGKNGDSSDDSSNDDDDDNSDGKVDWSVFLKNQMKGRKSTKKTKKV